MFVHWNTGIDAVEDILIVIRDRNQLLAIERLFHIDLCHRCRRLKPVDDDSNPLLRNVEFQPQNIQ